MFQENFRGILKNLTISQLCSNYTQYLFLTTSLSKAIQINKKKLYGYLVLNITSIS